LLLHTIEKRKEPTTPFKHKKKQKAHKGVTVHSLTQDDFNQIADQFRGSTE